MATKVTIQDIADELQLSRNTVSKAINNTGVLADATREKILRKAAEMGYKQFAYMPLFQEDAAKAAAPFILPSDKREIAHFGGFAQDLLPCGICQHTGVVDGL